MVGPKSQKIKMIKWREQPTPTATATSSSSQPDEIEWDVKLAEEWIKMSMTIKWMKGAAFDWELGSGHLLLNRNLRVSTCYDYYCYTASSFGCNKTELYFLNFKWECGKMLNSRLEILIYIFVNVFMLLDIYNIECWLYTSVHLMIYLLEISPNLSIGDKFRNPVTIRSFSLWIIIDYVFYV